MDGTERDAGCFHQFYGLDKITNPAGGMGVTADNEASPGLVSDLQIFRRDVMVAGIDFHESTAGSTGPGYSRSVNAYVQSRVGKYINGITGDSRHDGIRVYLAQSGLELRPVPTGQVAGHQGYTAVPAGRPYQKMQASLDYVEFLQARGGNIQFPVAPHYIGLYAQQDFQSRVLPLTDGDLLADELKCFQSAHTNPEKTGWSVIGNGQDLQSLANGGFDVVLHCPCSVTVDCMSMVIGYDPQPLFPPG